MRNKRQHADNMNVLRDMKAHPLGAIPHTGDGTGIAGSLRETGSCPSIEGAVGGATSAAYGTFFGPPRANPLAKH